jgi:putative DNA primase/helicase
MMDVRSLARLLDGEIKGRDAVSCPGPGHSRKDRSLSVRINPNAPDGFVCYSHAGDDWKVCRDYVRQRLGLPVWEPGDERNRTIPERHIKKWDLAVIESEAEMRERTEDDLDRIARAVKIWEQGKDPRRNLAQKYLNDHRKLDLPDELCGSVLRFHSSCPWKDEDSGNTIRVPALIAAFRSVDDDAITAIHRIRLNPDGSKYGRRMLGVAHRAAVKLTPIIEKKLVIGEGVETCMAAQQLGLKPAWALGSAGAISFFPVLDGIKQINILKETGSASAEAVKICGSRWQRAFRKAQIITPSYGSDLNDTIIHKAQSK